ncbi:hypothetical protein BDP27DRAFT_1406826 [Rhodocollybia butyracea]|uniref:Uncharacterized protein n=1 Tax=Rhodocollybia butyracea TaxID=206335 RepID=A0A9P5U0B3_9AGAR|nr:hypothetical protein BDP27DRAFT_1406826 [Rhodocollybia butyracea]
MLFDEAGILTEIGNISKYSVIGIAVMCVEFGVYIPLATAALYILWGKGLQKPPILIMFIIQIILVLNAIWEVVLVGGMSLLDALFYIFIDPRLDFEQGLAARLAAVEGVHRKGWSKMLGWPGNINLLVGDSVVVWRAWVLWEQRPVVRWMLIILGICNGALNILDSLYSSGIGGVPIPSDNTLRLFITNLFLLFSLALNIAATMLIVCKVWLLDRIHSKATVQPEHATERSPHVNVVIFFSGVRSYLLHHTGWILRVKLHLLTLPASNIRHSFRCMLDCNGILSNAGDNSFLFDAALCCRLISQPIECNRVSGQCSVEGVHRSRLRALAMLWKGGSLNGGKIP